MQEQEKKDLQQLPAIKPFTEKERKEWIASELKKLGAYANS